MSSDRNKEIVRSYLSAFNDHDEERMAEFVAEDVVEHGAREELRGFDERVEFLDTHFEAFPDYAGTTDEMIAEGDIVVARYTVTGTHSGEYHGIEATGHTVEWSGMAMYRIEDDEIAEIWLEADRLGLLEQLEALDPPAHLRV